MGGTLPDFVNRLHFSAAVITYIVHDAYVKAYAILALITF